MSDGYALSARWMGDWRPDVVLSGHADAMWTDPAFFTLIDRMGLDGNERRRSIAPFNGAGSGRSALRY